MRSFNVLSLAATFAFTTFAYAAPLDLKAGAALGAKVDARSLANVNVEDVDVLSNRALIDADVEEVDVLSSRDDLVAAKLKDIDILSSRDLPDVLTILNGLTSQLQPIVEKIDNITGADDVVATLTPLVGQVVSIVGGAVKNVNAIASANVKVSVDVSAVAQLVAQLISLVVTALGTVVKVAASGDVSQVNALVGQVNDVLTELVKALAGIIDGLLGALTPLVGGLVSTLTTLGFSTLGGVLGFVL